MPAWIVVGVYFLVPILAWRRTREMPGATKTENRVKKCGNACLAWGVIGVILASLAALQLLYVRVSPETQRTWTEHFFDMWLFWAVPLGVGLAIKVGQTAREKQKKQRPDEA
ncbi:MAG: hypothetical protein LBQ51_07885 [Desulfovibrio sp.]|jgi:hypothetical protein|nr:hypothetical protein [Desulfovibrio sp.]